MRKKSRKQTRVKSRKSRKSKRKTSKRRKKSIRKASRRNKKSIRCCKYTITAHTRRQAKKYGVQVRKSTNAKKKIDVFKNGKKIASVGACGYGDYPTFQKTRGMDFAKRRRAAYKKRHEKNRHRRGSPGFYADKLLW